MTVPALYPRHVEARLREALKDTRVVALVGPRQSGKTTLARRVGAGRLFLTLDDEASRTFALSDPVGFLRGLDTAVIDEIQRAPNLLLAIKRSVDEDPRPGRFLITGSADLFAGAIAPDSLAGRVETIPLLPLSQAELGRAKPPTFVTRAFAGTIDASVRAGPSPGLIDRVLAGGFPEAVARDRAARRRDWLLAYARSLAERDVPDLAALDKIGVMERLIEHAALMSGQLLNLTELGARTGLDAKTVDRWLVLLERLFLLRRVRPWFRNDLKRLVKTPKLQFLDSGLLAALRRLEPDRLGRDRGPLGPLLECFVHAELAKAVALSDVRTDISHYRDKDQVEVDFILERTPGQIVGVEVKASATVRPEDFRGLKALMAATGDMFACGVLLHDGERVVPFGDRLVAAPYSLLWQ